MPRLCAVFWHMLATHPPPRPLPLLPRPPSLRALAITWAVAGTAAAEFWRRPAPLLPDQSATREMPATRHSHQLRGGSVRLQRGMRSGRSKNGARTGFAPLGLPLMRPAVDAAFGSASASAAPTGPRGCWSRVRAKKGLRSGSQIAAAAAAPLPLPLLPPLPLLLPPRRAEMHLGLVDGAALSDTQEKITELEPGGLSSPPIAFGWFRRATCCLKSGEICIRCCICMICCNSCGFKPA
jgi:hypothetical protein